MTVQCRFEDRLAGRALHMQGYRRRIEARQASELAPACAAIDQARRDGTWVALLLDYEVGEWLVPGLAPDDDDDAAASRAAPLTALVFDDAQATSPWPAPDAAETASVSAASPRVGMTDYLAAVSRIRDMIGDGDLYQVNYTVPLDLTFEGDAQTLYRRLAHEHPSAHAAYIDDGKRRVLSFSPELFLARQGDCLFARPMKGTAPRGATPEADAALGGELLGSEKNRAENLMIVDLLRNDLSRLPCTTDIAVPDLFTLERYPTLQTLTSTVRASVQGELALLDLLSAAFPCGSITGAPKRAAMQAIRALEPYRRGLYCGSIGWLAPSGDFSLNVAIRTAVIEPGGQCVYGAGGGIVHDSDPLDEWHECLLKAQLLGATVQ